MHTRLLLACSAGFTAVVLSLLQEQTRLAACRAPGLAPMSVVEAMPNSNSWAAVSTEVPFGEVNDMLGVQLHRSIGRAGVSISPVE